MIFRFSIFFIITFLICSGCVTEPVVESTKQWEGHYYNQDSIQKAIQDIQLEKNESVWILSNSTLKRLLKNMGK